MTLWIWIGAALLVAFSASLLLAIALGRAAKHADQVVEQMPEVAAIAARLEQLSDVYSPAGRRFFPTIEARRELAEVVAEILAQSREREPSGGLRLLHGGY